MLDKNGKERKFSVKSFEVLQGGEQGEVKLHKQPSSGIVPYTKKEAANLTSRKGFVEGKDITIDSFIEKSLNEKGDTTEKLYLGKASQQIANKAKESTEIDIENFNFVIPSDNIRKIFKDHGTEATEIPRGQIPVTKEILSKIKEVLADPDIIKLSDNKTKDGKPVIVFEKRINGYAISVENVSDGQRGLLTQTYYVINKKKPPVEANGDNAPHPYTSETSYGTASDDTIIQNSDKYVNDSGKSS